MSYSDLNSIVLQKDAADSAAEVHGIAVAMLCMDKIPRQVTGSMRHSLMIKPCCKMIK